MMVVIGDILVFNVGCHDPVRKDLFLQLSKAEAEHASTWREKLVAAGVDAQKFAPSFRTRMLARLARRFGPRFVLPAIAATEFADRDKYANQAGHRAGRAVASARLGQ